MQAGVLSNIPRERKLTEVWQKLWDQLHDTNLKISLARFMTFCSRQDVQPSAVTDATVADFTVVLKLASLRKDPDLAIYYLTTSWNKVAGRLVG